MKKCIYCLEYIDTEVDDFEKVNRNKYVCAFCYDEYSSEINRSIEDEEEKEDDDFVE